MYIVGDIGNTEIKFCVVSQNFKKKIKFKFKTELISINFLKKKLTTSFFMKNNIKKVLFCSVVPKVFKIFKKFFEIKNKIKCLELKQTKFSKLLRIKVNKKQIGSDRLANAISIFNKKINYIIVDLGTATTFDVINKNVYIGGVIAPGVELSLKNLSKKASLIPKIKFKKTKKIIARNTVLSVNAGFFWGYVGLINNIIKTIKNETKMNYEIILTGGLSHMFNGHLKYKTFISRDLTLQGLIKTLKYLKKNEK